MKQFEVFYSYTGKGTAIVTAENEKDVEEQFYNGEWEEKDDESTDYCFDGVIGEVTK